MKLLLVFVFLCLTQNVNAAVQYAINKNNGDITECMQDSFYTQYGRRMGKLSGEYNDKNGIDGLFVKRNSSGDILECLIVDSKYGTSPLGKSKCGKQMSDTCVDDILNKLIEKEKKQYPTSKKSIKRIKEYEACMPSNKSVKTKKRIFSNTLSSDGMLTISNYDIDEQGVDKVKKGDINNNSIEIQKAKKWYGDDVSKITDIAVAYNKSCANMQKYLSSESAVLRVMNTMKVIKNELDDDEFKVAKTRAKLTQDWLNMLNKVKIQNK